MTLEHFNMQTVLVNDYISGVEASDKWSIIKYTDNHIE